MLKAEVYTAFATVLTSAFNSFNMPLPPLDIYGELPEGVHLATLAEVLARFGYGTPQRELVTMRLVRVYDLAQATGKLLRFVIFGSYVTAKPEPNDVDIILVMRDDFAEQDYHPESFPVFDHLRAQRELGASLFAIRSTFIFGETVDEFIAHWQIKRDLSRHGIVEIIKEVET
ncbi:MAG TPA: hypothetical protein VEX60_15710 [Pyrinomonadaceae bacterium]|nr:hypothetical protein [Pyrinomonadaceae bacterium]